MGGALLLSLLRAAAIWEVLSIGPGLELPMLLLSEPLAPA